MTKRRLHFITVRALDEAIAPIEKALREIAQVQAGCAELATAEARVSADALAGRGQLLNAAYNALDGIRRAVTHLPAASTRAELREP